ncbi:MAG: hypothetical protein FWF90_06365 [Promicromonosporaceae bacterium]|nr:hypothetical protein [Promicromonosporaceae bacterium]
MPLVAVRDAAERLGVSARQVQYLVAQGELTALARGAIDSESIDRLVAVRGQRHSRAWSPETAWGGVAILSGLDAPWMGGTQRSRLKARLRSMGAADLVERTRDRAEVVQYAGHSSVAERLKQRIIDTGASRSRLGLADITAVDGYVDANELEDLARSFGLARDTSGRVTLRATAFPIDTITRIADAGTVLAALDLAGSLEVRERTAGLDTLTYALEKLRD